MAPVAAAFGRATWRRGLWWALAYAALAALEAAFYPTVKQSAAALGTMMDSMPAAMRQAFGGYDLNTFAGWISTEFFAYFGLLAAIAAAFGALDVALRERDRGTLEEWLALPVARGAYFWSRVAVWLGLNLAAVVPVAPLLWILARAYGSPLPAGGAVGATLLTFALAAVFGAAVLVIAGLARDMGVGIGAALALPFVLYMADVVLEAAHRWSWLRRVIPFHYYHPAAALTATGLPLRTMGGFGLAVAALLLLAWCVFERREPAA